MELPASPAAAANAPTTTNRLAFAVVTSRWLVEPTVAASSTGTASTARVPVSTDGQGGLDGLGEVSPIPTLAD